MSALSPSQELDFEKIPNLKEYFVCMERIFLKISKEFLEMSNEDPIFANNEFRVTLVSLWIQNKSLLVRDFCISNNVVDQERLKYICDLLAGKVVGKESEIEEVDKQPVPGYCDELLEKENFREN